MNLILKRLFDSSVVRIVTGFALAALLLYCFGWLVTGPYKNLVAGFDSNIRYFMRQIQSPLWTTPLLVATKFGSTIYLIVIGCVAGLVLLVMRRWKAVMLLILTMAGQAVLHHGFKLLIARPRPSALINYPATESFSYPSGHAIASVCLYFTIARIVSSDIDNSALRIVLWLSVAIFVFLIGMSRVYIGIHYPTDVVAGWIAAAVWTAAVMSIDRRPL